MLTITITELLHAHACDSVISSGKVVKSEFRLLPFTTKLT